MATVPNDNMLGESGHGGSVPAPRQRCEVVNLLMEGVSVSC